MKYSDSLPRCQVMITAETTVTGTLHEKFNVTGMEEDYGDFYISIAANDGK